MAWLYNYMTFGVYIRIIIELDQILLISSSYEIYQFDTSRPSKIISLIIAFVIYSACIAFLLFFFVHWQYYSMHESRYFDELYGGLKDKKIYKGYELYSLFRKFLLITFIIFLQEFHSQATITCMCLTQFCFLSFLIYMRPYEKRQDNFIEILSESIYSILLIILVYYNQIGRWTGWAATGAYSLLICNNLIILAALLTFSGHGLCRSIFRKRKQPQMDAPPEDKGPQMGDVQHEHEVNKVVIDEGALAQDDDNLPNDQEPSNDIVNEDVAPPKPKGKPYLANLHHTNIFNFIASAYMVDLANETPVQEVDIVLDLDDEEED